MSFNVEKKIGVVPDIPLELEIDDASYNIFYAGNDGSTSKTFVPKFFAGATQVHFIYKRKTDSAGDGHCPVGEATPKDFDDSVSHRSDEIDKGILF